MNIQKTYLEEYKHKPRNRIYCACGEVTKGRYLIPEKMNLNGECTGFVVGSAKWVKCLYCIDYSKAHTEKPTETNGGQGVHGESRAASVCCLQARLMGNVE